MKTLVRLVLLAAFCLSIVPLSACNTTKGAGRDMEKAGEGIQNSASRHGAD